MAREYGRYLSKSHRDCDWTALTTTQHDCFMALVSSEDINWAGVLPYVPTRFAGLAADLTERKVEAVWAELARANLLVIDKKTGELGVRTFIKHDNVLAKPNLTKAFIRAFSHVRSASIRQAIMGELAKLLATRPDLAGWAQIEEQLPELFLELFAEGFQG